MSAKARALIDFIGYYALLLPVCLVILWNSQSFVSFAWRIYEGSSEADGIRGEFLLKTLIPIFALMMICALADKHVQSARLTCRHFSPRKS